jgi:hypothetical protein
VLEVWEVSGVEDLVDFLRARLDEDEQTARAATWGPWEVGPTFGGESNRVYVKPEGPGIDTIGTCVIAGQVSNMPLWRGNAQHIARWDPDRVLAEVMAKRRVMDVLRSYEPHNEWDTEDDIGLRKNNDAGALRYLALPYADHPDYREEWRLVRPAE